MSAEHSPLDRDFWRRQAGQAVETLTKERDQLREQLHEWEKRAVAHVETAMEADTLKEKVAALTKEREERFDCHSGPGFTTPPCGACTTCLLRERDQLAARVAEQEEELFAARVEATREYKEVVSSMSQVLDAAKALAKRYDVPEKRIVAALSEPDEERQNATLKSLAAQWGARDASRLFRMGDDMLMLYHRKQQLFSKSSSLRGKLQSELFLLREVEKAAREVYTSVAIVSKTQSSEDDHFRLICANDELHYKLKALDAARKEKP